RPIKLGNLRASSERGAAEPSAVAPPPADEARFGPDRSLTGSPEAGAVGGKTVPGAGFALCPLQTCDPVNRDRRVVTRSNACLSISTPIPGCCRTSMVPRELRTKLGP